MGVQLDDQGALDPPKPAGAALSFIWRARLVVSLAGWPLIPDLATWKAAALF